MHKKLFIPGPVEVREEVLKEMSRPMIGHRAKEFSVLYDEIVPKMRKVLNTENLVILSTSSATGLMEGAIRNCVKRRALNTVCGAFSERWHEITVANGKPADVLEVEWGKAIKPEMIDEKLKTGKYDAITVVHNETSTGVANPLSEIAEVMKNYPDVLFLVDCVSSMAGYNLKVDELGVDVILAGVQKCFGMPPGFAVCAVSEKAIRKAETVENRGYYFDFLEFKKYHERSQTPATPSISHMYALNYQLDCFLKEGMENRQMRHKKMADMTRQWAGEHFKLFPEEGYESITLTVIENTRNIVVADLIKELARDNIQIANGYGKIKEKTFRIAHMADITPEEIEDLLGKIDHILKIKV